jgi:hypothetical protein
MKYLTFLILLLTSTACLSAPQLAVCFDGNCETKINITLSDEAWSKVESIFAGKTLNNKQERECISKAFAIIEKDAFGILSKQTNNELSAEDIHGRTNSRDEATNSRNIVSLLLNNHLSKRYYLRKTEKRSSWFGFNEHAIILQARNNAKTYAIDTTVTGFGVEPIISLYNKWKTAKSYINLPVKTYQLIMPTDTPFKKNDE